MGDGFVQIRYIGNNEISTIKNFTLTMLGIHPAYTTNSSLEILFLKLEQNENVLTHT